MQILGITCSLREAFLATALTLTAGVGVYKTLPRACQQASEMKTMFCTSMNALSTNGPALARR